MNEPPSFPPSQPKNSPLAIWSLILGILSLCCFSICTAIPAVICGHLALGRIKRSMGALTGGGLAIAGLVTGYIGIAISIFILPMMLAIAVPNFVKARQTAQMNACINNLRQIDAAKQQWVLEKAQRPTDTPTWDDLSKYLKHAPLICPAGGTYTIHTAAEQPTCTIPGHELPASR